MIAFDNSYARLPARFFAQTSPGKVRAPEVIKVNEPLAALLGIDLAELGADVLSGNAMATGSEPIALAYAGHQFGNFVPQLGDGRAILRPAALMLEVLGVNKVWPGNPVNWHYRCLYQDSAVRSRVEQPAGAFFMFSRLAWERIGGFDERFWPIWFEDVDFCASLKRTGFSVWFNPRAVAKHTGAHSIRTLSVENRERYWYGSLLEYAAPPSGVVQVIFLAGSLMSQVLQ